MATSVTFNGTSYSIPGNREPRGWGTSLSAFLVDVANSSLSKAGGNFTLTADSNFGANYGLVVKYIKSVSSNIAASGVVRLANTDKIAFRNNANGADLELGVSTSDRLQFDSVNVPTVSSTDTLTNKTISAASNTISGLTKSDVGLGNVDNTSDATKNAASATLTNKTISGASNTLTVRLANDVTGTLPIANGGTGQTDANAALNALLPTQTGNANKVLKTDGTDTSWTAVATTVTSTLGDIIYRDASADTRLAGNTAAEPAYLVQQGNGAVSAAPTWKKVSELTKIRLQGANGYGSTNNKIRRFSTAVVNTGTGLTYADSASDGATFTCDVAGIYSFAYSDNFSGAGARFGLSLNSNQLTTDIVSITAADCLVYSSNAFANVPNQLCVTVGLAVGDVVRPHTEGVAAGDSAAPKVTFTVQRIA